MNRDDRIKAAIAELEWLKEEALGNIDGLAGEFDAGAEDARKRDAERKRTREAIDDAIYLLREPR